MKKLLVMVLCLFMLCGCGGSKSAYADLTVLEGVQLGVEDYGIAFREGSDMVDLVNDITKDLFETGKMKEIAGKYDKADNLVTEFKVIEEQAVSGESDYEYIKNKGTFIVGITDYKPMDYLDENGEWIGVDADYTREVASRLGLNVEFLEIDWGQKEMALQTKQIDCIWNGMTITDAIKNSCDVTAPYMKNYQVVVVKDAQKYNSLESLKDAIVVAEGGSAGESAAKENEYLNVNYKDVETQNDALLQVKSGAADACVIDYVMASSVVGK